MTQLDFLGKAKYAVLLSALLVVGSVLAMVFVGLRPGVDFTGGLQLTLVYEGRDVSAEALRTYLAPFLTGRPAPSLHIYSITSSRGGKTLPGKVVVVQGASDEQREAIRQALVNPPEGSAVAAPVESSITDIGGQVSREIINRAWQAILVALAAMLVYIAWRFRLRYGVAAVVALIHDVVITLGVFTVARIEVNLPVIAALLTVVGYSLNATIIIFDRVRENVRTVKKAPLYDLINRAINQTLTRTVNTGLTTLIPIAILFVAGGLPLRGLTVAMLMGVMVGTYSSIFVANSVLYGWSRLAEGSRPARS